MKKLLALSMAAACLLTCSFSQHQSKTSQYELPCTVVEISEDTVLVEDFDGYLWEFYGAEDFSTGEDCVMTMDDNGTETIFDDIIVCVR